MTLSTTTQQVTRSLAPIVALLPMPKPHTPAPPVDTIRQTALHHIAVVETVARRTRDVITNQQDTAHLHHATAMQTLDTAPVRHVIAMCRLDHPSRLRM